MQASNRPAPELLLQELKAYLLEASDLSAASAVLGWDQATYMPPGGATARARQSGLLNRLNHEKLVDKKLGLLLDRLEPLADRWPYDSDEASFVRVARRDFEKARKVPAEFVARSSELASASYQAWVRARPENDFAAVRPFLERSVELSRDYAAFFSPYAHVADPLIDKADPGLTAATVTALFAKLRHELLPLLSAVTAQPLIDDSCVRGSFDEQAQNQFGLSVVERVGYDLTRGRLDQTKHPFTTRFSPDDVRITTRLDRSNICPALFATLHEAGHALYEQGVSPALEGDTLGCGVSAGVHESQSRLWENIVGRSRGFWRHYFPLLAQSFPDAFGAVAPETFYRAINKVQRSLIRTEADELTYNLHIMLRFELELQMLEGRIEVRHLPELWRESMRSDLGVVPTSDADGCMQDVHWYSGSFGGAFQGYTIGNILSAQFYEAALRAQPEIPAQIADGAFETLHGWLRQNVYRHGRKFGADELVKRSTGAAMTIEPYIRYLRGKFGDLFGLSEPIGG